MSGVQDKTNTIYFHVVLKSISNIQYMYMYVCAVLTYKYFITIRGNKKKFSLLIVGVWCVCDIKRNEVWWKGGLNGSINIPSKELFFCSFKMMYTCMSICTHIHTQSSKRHLQHVVCDTFKKIIIYAF